MGPNTDAFIMRPGVNVAVIGRLVVSIPTPTPKSSEVVHRRHRDEKERKGSNEKKEIDISRECNGDSLVTSALAPEGSAVALS